MLRGAEILFSAIFAVTFLKRPLNKLHYGGIAGCLAGICLVGASSLLSPGGGGSSQAGMVLLGMALIVVAQVRAPPGNPCALLPRGGPMLLMCWQPTDLRPSRSSPNPCRGMARPFCSCSLSWGWHAWLGHKAVSADVPRPSLCLWTSRAMQGPRASKALAEGPLMLCRLCKLPRSPWRTMP